MNAMHPVCERGDATFAMPILLHVCCAPCAGHCAQWLGEQGYAVQLCFANANLAPAAEYRKRLDAAQQLATSLNVPLHEAPETHAAWLQAIRGTENAPEGGARCEICFAFNLRAVARMARELGVERFTTSLTVSPHKSSRLIFAVGQTLEGFVAIDFKKQDGFRKSLALSTSLGLYRQTYCGCEFSFR